jgi:hypothetical protein
MSLGKASGPSKPQLETPTVSTIFYLYFPSLVGPLQRKTVPLVPDCALQEVLEKECKKRVCKVAGYHEQEGYENLKQLLEVCSSKPSLKSFRLRLGTHKKF